MKLSVALGLIAALVIFNGTQYAEAQDRTPTCNAANERCIVDTGWGSGNLCVDATTTSDCIADTMTGKYYYHPNCKFSVSQYTCDSLRGEEQAPVLVQKDQRTTCGSSGDFCGWRDNYNKSGNGTSNSYRAKLHSCAVNGHTGEQSYGNSSCALYADNSSVNGYCSATTWSNLCASAGY